MFVQKRKKGEGRRMKVKKAKGANRMKRKASVLAVIFCMALPLLAGCGKVPPNSVHSLEDLKGKKIGVQLETTGDVFASEIEDADVKRFNKGRDAVIALRKGQIDAVMLDDEPARVFAEEFGDVELLDTAYADEEYGIAVNKENDTLLKQINEALKELKADGTIEKIETAWLREGEKVSAYESKKESYGNGKLLMVTNAEFPPYESLTDKDEIVGIDVDIMKAVCDKLDKELVVENRAFDSLLSAVERNKADVAVAAITVNEDRLQQVDFTDTYMKARQVIIVRKD